jgi:apolipoprotein N-acyltransferase
MLASTAVFLPLLFPPFYCFFLAPVALVPFCVCVLRRPFRVKNILSYYLLGAAFFIPNLFWLGPVTIGGFVALALFVALYFPLFAFGLHRLVVHLRLPATVAVPVVWTAVEYLRASFVLGGFPWFLLGNCLAPAPLLIQGADLFGVWGLTFLIACLNGFVVDVLRLPLRQRGRFSPVIRRLAWSVGAAGLFVLGYGVFRLNQRTTTPGPRIAVLQANFPQRVKDDPGNATLLLDTHLKLATDAARATPRPDLIVWPETMVPAFLNESFIKAGPEAFRNFFNDGEADTWREIRQEDAAYCRSLLKQFTDTYRTAQLLGYGALEPRGTLDASIKQNRTVLLLPDTGYGAEYNKVHLVPFGEFIPFRSVPGLGKAMIALSPYGFDYSNIPGAEWTRFELPVRAGTGTGAATTPAGAAAGGGGTYAFGTPICFEDTMPYPARMMSAPQFAGGRKADFLVNVSNDGWFHWVELDQHLQACQLRAVENRIAIARSVNTGNSGFIDSNGRIMGLVTNRAGSSIGAVGTLAMDVPVDARVTLYARVGDLLPMLCGVVSTVLTGYTIVRPRRAAAADGAAA